MSHAMECELGVCLRMARLLHNVPQARLAQQAGVSVRALRSLENGQGATVHTLMCVVRALGRDDWVAALAPGVDAGAQWYGAMLRQRAYGGRHPVSVPPGAADKQPGPDGKG